MNMYLSGVALFASHEPSAVAALQVTESTMMLGGLELNVVTRRVHLNGQRIELGPTEFRILQFFMQHPEVVHSRSALLSRLWGKDVVVGLRTVDVHIRRLRKAMEPAQASHLVQTVRSQGYRLSLQV